MKKLLITVSFMTILLVGCSQTFSTRIDANNQPNVNKIDFKEVLDDIDVENYDHAQELLSDLKQKYPDDYMTDRLLVQINSYLNAETIVNSYRDWDKAIDNLKIAEARGGSKKIMKAANALEQQIDVNKQTFDGHSTERERMIQSGASDEEVKRISDQEINRVLTLSKEKGEPEPHQGEYPFIETMAEEHPELNMSIKKYEDYWSK